MKTHLSTLAATLLALGTSIGAIGAASAATSFESLVNTDGTINTAQDLSGEAVYRPSTVNGVTTYNLVTSGNILSGDLLAGAFVVDTLNTQSIGSGATYTGMGGLFLTQVTNISGNSVVQKTDSSGTLVNINVANFAFAATTDVNAWAAIFGLNVNTYYSYGALDAGTMVILTQDTDQSFDGADFGTPATTVTEAKGSASEFWVALGFDSVGDEFWTSTGTPTDLSQLVGLPPSTNVGQYSFGLDVLNNNSSFTFSNFFATKDYQWYADSGNVYSPGSGNGWPVEDDVKLNFRATVPEPATLALAGLGLLGVGFSRRRRNSH